MSETKIGHVTVTALESGAATVADRGEMIYLMPDDRPAVALALLGGLTGALVERAAKALHDPADVGAAWDGCAICERDARRVVQAIFGVEDGEPGSGQ